jgi:hypothetical protein
MARPQARHPPPRPRPSGASTQATKLCSQSWEAVQLPLPTAIKFSATSESSEEREREQDRCCKIGTSKRVLAGNVLTL